MRKLFVGSTLIIASLALLAGGNAALACGAKSGTAKSADASSCGSKVQTADVKTAGSDGAVQASAGCCAGKMGAQAGIGSADGASCHGKMDASSASADHFLSGYLGVKGGMVNGCCPGTQASAASYHEMVKAMLDSGKVEEQRVQLESLLTILASWPAERAAQKDRFAQLTEWTIGYCKSFPERATGIRIQADPASGKSWVQVSDETGNPYAG
jgi:hypothetical protein